VFLVQNDTNGEKVKGQFHPITYHENTEREKRCKYTLSITSVIDWIGWLTPRPCRFNPGKKNRYPLHRSVSGSQARSGRMGKILPLPRLGTNRAD
jgi:hypothetical protein